MIHLKVTISEPKLRVPFVAFDSKILSNHYVDSTTAIVSLLEIVRCKTVAIEITPVGSESITSMINSFELLNITDVNMFMFNTGKIKVANTKKSGDIVRAFDVLKDNLLKANVSKEIEK